MNLGEVEEEKRRVKAAEEEALKKAAEAARKAAEAEAARKAAEQKTREDAAKANMGARCPAGYAWVREATGRRCTAGGHFVPY